MRTDQIRWLVIEQLVRIQPAVAPTLNRIYFSSFLENDRPMFDRYGRLLIVDSATGKTYWIHATFNVDTVYTETYYSAGVEAVVGQLDPGTGNITPIAIGFTDPTGLLFVPDR